MAYSKNDKGFYTCAYNTVEVLFNKDSATYESAIKNVVVKFSIPSNARDTQQFASAFHNVVLGRANTGLTNLRNTVDTMFDNEEITERAKDSIFEDIEKAQSANIALFKDTSTPCALVKTWVTIVCPVFGNLFESSVVLTGEGVVKGIAEAVKGYAELSDSEKVTTRNDITATLAPLFESNIEDFKIREGKITDAMLVDVITAINGREKTLKASVKKGIKSLKASNQWIVKQVILQVLKNKFAFAEKKPAKKSAKVVYKF